MAETVSEKISQCHHCKVDARAEQNIARGVWEVRCTKCPTFVWDANHATAIKKWNRAIVRLQQREWLERVKAPSAKFAANNACWEWEYHIPDSLREMWPNLTPEEQRIAYLVASCNCDDPSDFE